MLNNNTQCTDYLDLFLKRFFKNTNNVYTIFFKKRFQVLDFKNLPDIYEKIFYQEFFYDIFNDYTYFTFKKIYELTILFIYIRNNFHSYRFFLGYPLSSRTRSNGKSSTTQTMFFKHIILKYIYYRLYKKQKETDKTLLLFVEFFNKLWFFQWHNEWVSAKLQLEKAVIKKFFKWKFGYLFLSYNRPIVFVPKRSKQKSNKRRQVELKNTYNIGFYIGFTNKFKEIIKKFNTVQRKGFKIK